MLHRSYSFLNFIRNASYHCADEVCIFQIGVTRRHFGASVIPKYGVRCKVHVISNSQSNFGHKKVGKITDLKWTCVITRRAASSDSKGREGNRQSQEEKASFQDTQDRVIELNEEKLGKLKERILSVGVVGETDEKKKNEPGKAAEILEKTKVEVKEISKEESTLKKAKKRLRVDRSTSSLERNFITPVKAMSTFLLKPSDLESLPKTKRRSPYEFEPPITVYWRKDVEAKALEVWGSREALLKELLKKEVEQKTYQQNIFTVKRRLRDYRREMGNKAETIKTEGLFGRSGRVVLTAVVINASNFLFKLFAWIYTDSHSMFSECIHSAADTCNQLILAYGIHKSVQNPNADHPYGYTNMKYVSSLISGVGIFCVGTGLSIYHGIHGLLFPSPVESFYWAYFILGGSLVSEGATLLVAINSIKKGAEEKKENFWEYVLTGRDPSVNVVLMEDFAAVLGLVCAATCMGLTSYLGNPMFDAVGSLLVGGLLGGVASFIIYTNVAALVGRSIPQENLDKINAELESDIMVRAIHDVKGIDMGNNLVRYKAELDFDGRELTRSYLDKHDLIAMLEEVKSMQNIDELEAFLLKHGESIVDMLGGEIDRIELKLKKNHPEIRHCDLEIL
ncbi:hypothetical protein KPH14_002856 [Odynerus spinipes]|uniref:Proton-coupled zinc antiporter SLC30A9, mitochondrial n=1 Tax=Odynerus spinipes TaxID=1348599 RepID=A0AAD9RW79_9HYME|nr:hypothetical protein KPH14_002856 [Odynerus spinipes]